jgi:3-deoxy-D-manno-octulosonic-acid transferase
MNGYDVVYTLGLAFSAPVWLARTRSRRKVFRALRERTGHYTPLPGDAPLVMVHAVSLGEMNATRELIKGLAARRPELRFLVTSTTDTGYARGLELYRDNAAVRVERFPLDFSGAIRQLLDTFRPAAVVLMELEVWPNFMRHCARRGAPVVVVNGRLTEGSYRNYQRGALITRGMFARLAGVCAQEEIYAERFRALGVAGERVRVTGTMKFDTAVVAERIEGDAALAAAVGLGEGEPTWVCGSTGPGEEGIVLRIFQRLRADVAALRLVIVPRKPERFDEVAQLITAAGLPLVRRSRPAEAIPEGAIVLGDTMGELRKFYSLASVVFVGRSLVDLGGKQHGSDMIEPAGLAKPTVVGPYTTNFADVMDCFRRESAMMEVRTEAELEQRVRQLLSDATGARALGSRAQQVVLAGKGATERHVEEILRLMQRPGSSATSGKRQGVDGA